jgi:type II secretory pathway pseudopilin PulG
MFRRMRSERGFTVVELVVILFITAILVGIVVSGLAGIAGAARSKAAAEELDIVQSAFDTLMIEVGAITVSENLVSGGLAVGSSTLITCYRHDGTTVYIPTGDYYLRLRTNSSGKYTWDSEGFVRQVSY